MYPTILLDTCVIDKVISPRDVWVVVVVVVVVVVMFTGVSSYAAWHMNKVISASLMCGWVVVVMLHGVSNYAA